MSTLGKVTGFSLHADVAAKANERNKLECLCRYIARPAVSEQHLSLPAQGKVRYELKTPYRDGTRVLGTILNLFTSVQDKVFHGSFISFMHNERPHPVVYLGVIDVKERSCDRDWAVNNLVFTQSWCWCV